MGSRAPRTPKGKKKAGATKGRLANVGDFYPSKAIAGRHLLGTSRRLRLYERCVEKYGGERRLSIRKTGGFFHKGVVVLLVFGVVRRLSTPPVHPRWNYCANIAKSDMGFSRGRRCPVATSASFPPVAETATPCQPGRRIGDIWEGVGGDPLLRRMRPGDGSRRSNSLLNTPKMRRGAKGATYFTMLNYYAERLGRYSPHSLISGSSGAWAPSSECM